MYCSSEARLIACNYKRVKMSIKKTKHVTSHVLAETTHLVAAPHGFTCVVTPATKVSSKFVRTFRSHSGSKF